MARRRRGAPLPPRHGVDATRVVPRVPGLPLIDVLRSTPSLATLDVDALTARFAAGEVVDSGGQALQPGSVCPVNRPVFLYRDLPVEHPVPFELSVLHADDDIVVVDKPHFLATMPRGEHVVESALVRLRRLFDDDEISPVHRLDRVTAGVVLFTRRTRVRRAYHELFADRRVDKEYRAAAPPPPPDLRFPVEISDRIVKTAGDLRARREPGPVNAITLVEHLGPASGTGNGDPADEYRLVPRTGRTHQLRVHMSSLGLPIVGDPLYPHVRADLAALPGRGDFTRPLRLVARRLSFEDPFTGERRTFESAHRVAAGAE